MNKAKEKKLKNIKSEILEIKNFVASNINDDLSNDSTYENVENNRDDTVTLTKIVDYDSNSINKNDLNDIKHKLDNLKLMLTNQEKTIKEILSRIK